MQMLNTSVLRDKNMFLANVDRILPFFGKTVRLYE